MLGILFAVVLLAIVYLRVPSFVAFFSLLVGQLLATEASEDVYEFAGSVLNIAEFRYVQVALLLLPFLLTILFLKGRVPKSKLFIEILPAAFVSATAITLLYPLIPELQDALVSATEGRIDDYKTIVISAASISGLVSAWLTYPKHGSSDKHGKKHK
jgi:hypothetical protein